MDHRTLIKLSATFCLATLPALLTGCSTASPHMSSHSHTNQTPHSFTYKQTRTAKINYLLHLPKNYDGKGSEKYPLILFLHGAGERGTNIWKVATHGPAHVVTTNSDFPFIVVSPQCPEGQHWESESLLALLDDVKKRYAVDKHRVYLTGLSMGGYGAWAMGIQYPDLFAAVAPVCGGGEPDAVCALENTPVWAFHGDEDSVVDISESQKMVNALEACGGDVKFTVYPGVGHDSWTQTYNNPELYQWFLSHKRHA